jgi:hypothetical protein
LTADYVYNHAVGMPNLLPDYERRRDAGTLNVAAARSQVNRVLGNMSVDQWIAANPTRNISAFSLASDTIYQGLYADMLRARFISGGFSKYSALQLQLRGMRSSLLKLRDNTYMLSYALARNEASAVATRGEFMVTPNDNLNPNSKAWFGPTGLDYTHFLRAAWFFTTPGGFVFNSFWTFRSAGAQTLTVPNLGGAISGANGMFGTDLNGDGGAGSTPRADLFPGVNGGQFGRAVKSLKDLNQIIQQYNSTQAGQLTPNGKALVSAGLFTEAQLKKLGAVSPTVPLVPENNPTPWHNLFTCDLRFMRPISLARLREGMRIVPSVDFLNLFNHAPRGLYGGLTKTFGNLNYDYANAPAGLQASDLDYRVGRLNNTRRVQIGLRFDF